MLELVIVNNNKKNLTGLSFLPYKKGELRSIHIQILLLCAHLSFTQLYYCFLLKLVFIILEHLFR